MKQGKKAGYIIKVPVKKIEKGMHVLWNNLHGIIYKIIETSPEIIISPLSNGNRYRIKDISTLSTLKVEYESRSTLTLRMQTFRDVNYQIPLKYSQWSAALENQEVNNPAKPIFFEEKVYDCEYNPIAESYDTKSVEGLTIIAKIIPTREITYNGSELRQRMYQFCVDAGLLKPMEDGKHIIETIEEWLKDYDLTHKPKALK